MKPFHNPFAALGALKDTLADSPDPPPARIADASPSPAGKLAKTYPRAVVRMERAGRGGKEATVIEQLTLSASEREAWLKSLKAALGCGGSIEGDTIMLQGDHRQRLATLLTDRGVKKVTIG